MRLLLLLFALLGCGPEAGLRFREKRDRTALATAVSAYWSAVRWSDAAGASGFLLEPDDQLRVARTLAETPIRLTGAEVLQVVVHEELGDDRAPDVREGTAIVRVEAYDRRVGRVNVETVEQRWLRRKHGGLMGWYVDTARSPLDEDVPW